MAFAVALTLAFVIGEAVAGLIGHSLALLSDAGHNFADAAALAFSWYALCCAKKPAHDGMTYGYHRVGIFAAFINAVSLVVIALAIVWEGIDRLRHPEPAHGWLMVITATIAIGMNVLISLRLHKGSKHDINVRSAYLHMLGDAISAFGVVIAGILIALTGMSKADPIVSFLIAGLILWSSFGVLKESVGILLESTPLSVDMAKVQQAIQQVQGVRGMHDLHVWTVGPGVIACSCHILVDEQTVREGQQVLQNVAHRLDHDFHINHTTIQIEVEGHHSNEMYCSIEPASAGHLGHHH